MTAATPRPPLLKQHYSNHRLIYCHRLNLFPHILVVGYMGQSLSRSSWSWGPKVLMSCMVTSIHV